MRIPALVAAARLSSAHLHCLHRRPSPLQFDRRTPDVSLTGAAGAGELLPFLAQRHGSGWPPSRAPFDTLDGAMPTLASAHIPPPKSWEEFQD
ncbi:MAG: hypothetical protein KDD44_13455, partial [Bdellovibrionales bacterium]|nr:hypothetical protein [Bdellovibrionales bacterium]